MEGGDRVRFCKECRLNVYNLSEMSRQEAEWLVRNREGRLCVRFFRRRDGTLLTRDCPVGFRARVRRYLAMAAAAVAAGISVLFYGNRVEHPRAPSPGERPKAAPRFADAAPLPRLLFERPDPPLLDVRDEQADSSAIQGDMVAPPRETPDPQCAPSTWRRWWNAKVSTP
jgi:hypothetical protein